MLRLKYRNETGDEIYFKNDAPFFFLSHKGLDGAEAEAMLIKSPYQHGQTNLGANINERVVTINACLVTNSKQQEERYRRQLLNTITPLKSGELEIIGKSFKKQASVIQVVSAPVFADTDYTLPDGILHFSFTFIVPGNFLEDLEFTSFRLSEVLPLFEFELEFASYIEFGTIANSEIEIINDGEAEAPLIIEIPGPVETPMIQNKTTGEFIKVHSPILANEKMVITTSFGNKAVEITDDTGAKRNAFHYIDLDSIFFQLKLGRNLLKFNAEVGNDTATVMVYYKKLYLGI